MRTKLPVYKRNYFVYFLFSVVIVAVFVLSCNKQDNKATQQQIDESKKKAQDFVSEKGYNTIIQINEKLDAYYSDTNGNRLSEKFLKDRVNSVITSSCDYSNSPSATLTSLARAYKCQFGEIVTWVYTISTNNNLKVVNPYNANSKTKGMLRVYNAGTTTLAYSVDVTGSPNVTIVDNGADPNQSGYEKFTVTFKTGWIDEKYFNQSNYQIKVGASCATDCPDIESFPVAVSFYYFTTCGAWDSVYPCSRTDQVAINSSANAAGPAISLYGGYTVVGTPCDPSYYLPDLQEVRYSTDNGVTWSEVGMTFTNGSTPYYSNFNNVANKGYVDPYGNGQNFLQLTKGKTYTFIFQERNIKYNFTGTYPSPLPLPTTSNACFSNWATMPIPSGTTFTF